MTKLFIFKTSCDSFYLDTDFPFSIEEGAFSNTIIGNLCFKCDKYLNPMGGVEVPRVKLSDDHLLEVKERIKKYRESKEFDLKMDKLLS